MAATDPLIRVERAAAVTLSEPLPIAPTILHYEPGALTRRYFRRNGQPWLAEYEAEWDGVGFLVVRATCRPLVLSPGAKVHVKATVTQVESDAIEIRFDHPRGPQRLWIGQSDIVYLEEVPASAERA